MTALELATDATRQPLRPGIVARASNVVSNVYRAWRNRRAFYRLGDLSDAELSDIGLTRADLHVAMASADGLDPTARLRDIVDTRHALR